jgi:DNA polymerase-3 subunit epsilon
VSAEDVGNSEFENLYGIFRSRSSARTALRELSKAYGLCLALMGLERRVDEGPCLAYGSKGCRGACVGAESPISHAMRVVQALCGLRVKPWPYPGRVGVRERDPDGYRTELHIVDRWRYLGTVKSEADLHELYETSSQAPFDPDTYKILARFLKSPPRSCDIVALPRDDRQ